MSVPFTQAVLWPAVSVSADQVADFEAFILEALGTRAKFIGTFETLPDVDETGFVPGTGGRKDTLFYVHTDDIGKFAVPRFQYGMRWVDDVLDNERARGEPTIYIELIHQLRSWDKGDDDGYREDGSETGCVGE